MSTAWTAVSIALAIVRFVFFAVQASIGFLTQWTRYKRRYTGTYTSLVRHPSGDTRKNIYNIVSIRSHGLSGFQIRNVYSAYGGREYEAFIFPNTNYREFFQGTWKNATITEYFGACMFKSINDNMLQGPYIGPGRSDRHLKSGEWTLRRTNPKLIHWWHTWFLDRRHLHTDRELLDQIINKHLLYFASNPRRQFVYKDNDQILRFEIPTDGFKPDFGKISITLLEIFLGNEAADAVGKSVLDLGCGSGFYTVVCANRGFKAVGIDIDQSAVATARANRDRNSLPEMTAQFLHSENKQDPFSPLSGSEKFDHIIANMPFTNESCGGVHVGSPQFFNFVTTKETLIRMLAGVKFFLHDTGSMYMSFGRSGYWETLNRGCGLFGLQYEIIHEIQQRDEHFHVLRLSHTRPN